MGTIFGKQEDGFTDQDKAILKIKTQRDQLKKYSKQIEIVIEKENNLARQLMSQGKRNKARLCLKKKRFQENLLRRTEGNLINMEEMIYTIEFRKIENEVFEGLKEGNCILKELQGQLSIDDVEDILLETEEAIAHQEEIDNLLSERLTMEDEEDILRELAELQTEELNLPDVPTHELPTSEPQVEESPEITPVKRNPVLA
eukprot:TRINITY_DN7071_c0_g1_i1.p1 TRINITY_DN7071_c0_g1~~TRINITY_DN7071_c0_g1_i1.p1  ORF type:complete len:201 (+),score=60.05 TRINITY_DN7071_c0_g1_i1:36-638(+)